jgi:hypothetical protein
VQVVVVPIMAGVCQVWGQRRGGEEGGGNEKLRFGHFDSPEFHPKLALFGGSGGSFYAKRAEKLRKSITMPQFVASRDA